MKGKSKIIFLFRFTSFPDRTMKIYEKNILSIFDAELNLRKRINLIILNKIS